MRRIALFILVILVSATYARNAASEWTLKWEQVSLPGHTVPDPGYIRITEDGQHFAYLPDVGVSKERIVVHDGVSRVEHARWLALPEHPFSSNGKRFAYVKALNDGKQFDIDDLAGPLFSEVMTDSLAFSADNRQIAYMASDTKQYYAVWNNITLGPYRSIRSSWYTQTTKTGVVSLMYGHKVYPQGPMRIQFDNTFFFSPDGEHLAFTISTRTFAHLQTHV
jgi:hypothetical protein